VKDAFEIAQAGGRHGSWLKAQRQLGLRQLRAAARSIERQIDAHKAWLENPGLKVQDWELRETRYRDGLLRKWQQDILRQGEQLTILLAVIREKSDG
jgi:hypothetical protein